MITPEAHVPIAVKLKKDTTCDIYIPDFHVTVHGQDYIAAMANAACLVNAVCYFNEEHNITTPLNTTYEEMQEMCANDDRFPSYIRLVEGGIL